MNYVKKLLILATTSTVSVSISVFASVVGILMGFTSSAAWLKIWGITVKIKKYKLIIKKKR